MGKDKDKVMGKDKDKVMGIYMSCRHPHPPHLHLWAQAHPHCHCHCHRLQATVEEVEEVEVAERRGGTGLQWRGRQVCFIPKQRHRHRRMHRH